MLVSEDANEQADLITVADEGFECTSHVLEVAAIRRLPPP